VLRRFGETDAAGIARPGVVLTTEPGATVLAPAAGTVRHAGPLLDYANVIIHEPRSGLLLVFAGMSDVYVEAGEVVAAAAPLGAMGGELRDAAAPLRQPRAGGGASPPDTLYIEVREDGLPVDPLPWFRDE
jgi:septal ring factor EnvC (AmiA/AmiB activator)